MGPNYPNLRWALSMNATVGERIPADFGDKPAYLAGLEELFGELRGRSLVRIPEKLKPVEDMFRFSSAVAELEMARYLAARGKDVDILPGGKLSAGISWMDMGGKGYLEMFRAINNEPVYHMLNHLRGFLGDTPYRVDVKFNDALSRPPQDYHDRKRQMEILEGSMEEFGKAFAGLSATPASVRTAGVVYDIRSTESGQGYCGLIDSWPIDVPEGTVRAQISQRLVEKAKNGRTWMDAHPDNAYVIAVDVTEWPVDVMAVDRLVYGERVKIESMDDITFRDKQWRSILENKQNCIPGWHMIESAARSGWKAMLMEKAIIPMGYEYLVKGGLFISEKEMKNVTGVLLRTRGGMNYLPNPFASGKMNRPGLAL
jgi:hypothetical protein